MFKLAASGILGVLNSFAGAADARTHKKKFWSTGTGMCMAPPDGAARAGNGTFFSVAPNGKLTTLHGFTGNDGAHPFGGLIRDKAVGSIVFSAIIVPLSCA